MIHLHPALVGLLAVAAATPLLAFIFAMTRRVSPIVCPACRREDCWLECEPAAEDWNGRP